MLLFISATLSFVWHTGSVLDPPSDRDPVDARAALGPRITYSCWAWCILGDVIVRTLRNYGSYQKKIPGDVSVKKVPSFTK